MTSGEARQINPRPAPTSGESSQTEWTMPGSAGPREPGPAVDRPHVERLYGVLVLRDRCWKLATGGVEFEVMPVKEARRSAGQGHWQVENRGENLPAVSRVADEKQKTKSSQLVPSEPNQGLLRVRICPTCHVEKALSDFRGRRSPRCRSCSEDVERRAKAAKHRQQQRQNILKTYPEESSRSIRTIQGGIPGSSRRH